MDDLYLQPFIQSMIQWFRKTQLMMMMLMSVKQPLFFNGTRYIHSLEYIQRVVPILVWE